MNIPKRVTILGLDYTVERRDLSDDDECGFIVPRRQLIVIDEKVSDQLAAQTFLQFWSSDILTGSQTSSSGDLTAGRFGAVTY